MESTEAETSVPDGKNDEIERLTELVRQMETQNELLRTKHSATESDLKLKSKKESITNDINTVSNSKSEQTNTDTDILKAKTAIEELGILDLDKILPNDDEETWLYTSPKHTAKPQQKVNAYDWMQQEFKSPDVEPVKRTLAFKLGLVDSHAERGGSPEKNTSYIDSRTFTRTPKGVSRQYGGMSRQSTPHSINSLRPGPPDTRRSLSPQSNNSPYSVSPRNGGSPRISPEYDRNGNSSNSATNPSSPPVPSATAAASGGVSPGAGSDTVDAPAAAAVVTPPHRNHAADVMDIQVAARMQEESLRQSINSSPKKTFKGSLRNMTPHQQHYQQQQDHSSDSSNRSSPARFDGDMYQPHHRSSNNSLAGSLSSHSSSPPDSPYNSTQQLHNKQQPGLGMHSRRSLPNLANRRRIPLSPALHTAPSDNNIQSKLSVPNHHHHHQRNHRDLDPRDDDPNYDPEDGEEDNPSSEPPPALHGYGSSYNAPPARRSQDPPQNTSSTPQNRFGGQGGGGATYSKGVQRSIPSPSSGLMRGGGGGSGGIPRPRQSRLPAPRSSRIATPVRGGQSYSSNNHHMDDSWKDGCF